jgi:hypothetical protein
VRPGVGRHGAPELDSPSRLRLQGDLPVMVRKSDPLPQVVSNIQYIDVSRVTLQGRRYFAYPEFRRKINEIVVRIEQIAEELFRSQCKADCDLFQFPAESAFSDYSVLPQRFPLVS